MKFVDKRKYDIVVAGGGVAGIAAAVEAARDGKKVVIIDKSTQLGGLATIGLVNLFVPMCNGRGVQVIRGICDEMLQLAKKYGYGDFPSDWENGEPGHNNTLQRLSLRFSAPIYSLALCEYVRQHGIDVMFDTVVTDINATGGHIDSIIVFNKSGHMLYEADMFVDTTGDADILNMLGVPTVTQGNYHTYYAFGTTVENCKTVAETNNMAKLNTSRFGGRANLHGDNHPEGMPLWDGTNADSVTDYLITNQLELLDNIRDEDRRARDITLLPIMPQFRTTRHIDGNYTMTMEDAYKHHEYSVGTICDFANKDFLFEVPYGTLVCDGFDNVITAGRSAAAEGYMWDILRVIPPAIQTGQAAGAAVCQAIDKGVAITDIDIKALQAKLEAEDIMVHFDDALLPEDLNAVDETELEHI